MNNIEKTLILQNDEIIYGDSRYVLDDLYDENTINEWLNFSRNCNTESLIINEIYIDYIINYICLEKFLEKLDIDLIVIESNDAILNCFLKDYGKKNKIEIKDNKNENSYEFYIKGNLESFKVMKDLVYKFFKIKYKRDNISKVNKLALIRTPATNKKFKFLQNNKDSDILVLYENLTKFTDKNLINDEAIYTNFRFSKKLLWVIRGFFSSEFEMRKCTNVVSEHIGLNTSKKIYRENKKRILRILVFSYALDNLLELTKPKHYYTGNCLDGFANVEYNLCRKKGIKTICIPHGLEGFICPQAYIGDVFYTSSNNSKNALNAFYNTEKFIYDEKMCEEIYSYKLEFNKHKQKVVFFTAPVKVSVNYQIIEELSKYLGEKGIKLYVKIHPRESMENYSKFKGIEIIENLEEAITGNICVARGSTVLIETLYNKGKSANIMINSYDKYRCKSVVALDNENVAEFYDCKSLSEWVYKEMVL